MPFSIVEHDGTQPVYIKDVSGRSAGITNGALKVQQSGAVDLLRDTIFYRDEFIGASLSPALTGTVTMTNGSKIVSGSGSSFTTEVQVGDYVMRSVDANNWYRVASVVSDTQLLLETPYALTSGNDVLVSKWNFSASGTAGLFMGSSYIYLYTGANSGSVGRLQRQIPVATRIIAEAVAAVNNRIANQEIYIGLADNWDTPNSTARVLFSGTDNTQLVFETQASSVSGEKVQQTYTLPSGTTATLRKYRIELTGAEVLLFVDDVLAATSNVKIPLASKQLQVGMYVKNTAAASDSVLYADSFLFQYFESDADQRLPEAAKHVKVIGGLGNTFHAQGQVATSATTTVRVSGTTYNEPASAAQRSFSSSSANDSAAGTGARTIRVTYFDNNGNGPFQETLTLNGTTAVNTVRTNIRFVSEIEVLTVGSGGTNAGTITMFNSTGGGGGTLWSIATGAGATESAHHYVGSDRCAYITSMSVSNSQATVANGASFKLFAVPFFSGVAGAAHPLTGPMVVMGAQGHRAREFGDTGAICVQGFARIEVRVTPLTNTAATQGADFYLYEV